MISEFLFSWLPLDFKTISPALTEQLATGRSVREMPTLRATGPGGKPSPLGPYLCRYLKDDTAEARWTEVTFCLKKKFSETRVQVLKTRAKTAKNCVAQSCPTPCT